MQVIMILLILTMTLLFSIWLFTYLQFEVVNRKKNLIKREFKLRNKIGYLMIEEAKEDAMWRMY